MTARDIFLTTERSPSDGVRRWAKALAARLNVPFADRRHESIERLARLNARLAALVVGESGLWLVRDGRSYKFHPNMASRRVAALETGQTDRFVAATGLAPGDHLLDCTCGLGADAIVASHVVGPAGCVEAVEASTLLADIVSAGLARYDKGPDALAQAMRRVTVIRSDYASLLRSHQTSSRDIVYFDPMFETTLDHAQGLDLVRTVAVAGTPSREDVDEARRVARKCVVVKDRSPGRLLGRLGLSVVSSRRSTWYGRLACAQQ